MRNIILKYSLKNAFDFGKVNPNVVLGLVLKENAELRKDVPKVQKEIEKVRPEVESLSKEEIKKKLKELAPELLQKEKEDVKGPLKPLREAERGKVVVRMAPSPSGALHIGHAYGASLNYEYAKMYQGKFLLRIEDTNPENIYAQAYQLIEDDARWLTNNQIEKVIIQSSRLKKYQQAVKDLITKENAYVCTCNPDLWRELKNEGKACPCRENNLKENLLHYKKMFKEYAEGEAVVRLKTNIQDKNPAMRDFAIMRINEHIHPKTGTKERVWPLMILSVAIDDHELGVTHVLNGKDHTDNAEKEKLIMNCFNWKLPQYQHWGRINFEGFSLSATKTRLAIEQNEYNGWDDIRLPFLPALRRRGYQAEALRKFAGEIGLSLNDKTVSKDEFWKMINAFNKELVEPKANRYFFVDNPLKITIENAPLKKISLNLHPDFPERGLREFKATKEILISEMDHAKLEEGKIHRLMDGYNFEKKKGKWKYVSDNYEEFKVAANKGLIIHWLPTTKLLNAEVLLENGELAKGKGEDGMSRLQEGDIVQLERRYFARVDQIEKNKIKFWFLHR